jgi:hypothetical protein
MFRSLLLSAVLFAQTGTAEACTCPRPSLEDLLESGEAIAVFSARVISILAPEKGKPTVTRLQVNEVIKGDVPRVVEMIGVTLEDNPCGVDFRPGEMRIMAASKRDGRWFTNLCLLPQP